MKSMPINRQIKIVGVREMGLISSSDTGEAKPISSHDFMHVLEREMRDDGPNGESVHRIQVLYNKLLIIESHEHESNFIQTDPYTSERLIERSHQKQFHLFTL